MDEVSKVGESVSNMKKFLLDQQSVLKSFLMELSPNNYGSEGKTTQRSALIGPDEIHSAHFLVKICPMCEAKFETHLETSEEFVSHVNSHFSFEDESETIHDFDLVHEAF